jgi:uncharacterized membrane protein YkvA (DUF1232 family)
MHFEQLTELFAESGLSPEKLSTRLGISNLTYRRWLKRNPADEVPKEYRRNIAGGVYQLLSENKLNHDSPQVGKFLENNLPEFFEAVVGQFNLSPDLMESRLMTHQDKVTTALLHIGNSDKVRKRVEAAFTVIRKFAAWGDSWKERITLLTRAVRSKELSLADKLIAYGALFYLILPIDLIPDSIPIFGYIDDFGILGFAAAYYFKKHPGLSDSPEGAAAPV